MSEANYSKKSFPAVLVEDQDAGDTPGFFYYVVNQAGEKCGIVSCLPNAKDQGSSWGATMFRLSPEIRPSWNWNGNIEKPSLTPSIHRVGHWHGYLTDGRFVSQ